MRNLPPRMTNQPLQSLSSRKDWEMDARSVRSANARPIQGMSSGLEPAQSIKSSKPQTGLSKGQEKLLGLMARNQHIYDDTGNRITYRGAFVARGGRGWSG